MSSLDTKLDMVKALAELANTMPFDKISVSDIVAASGKNRKTFYYHFKDKAHMVAWMFRRDMAQQLSQVAEPGNLASVNTGDAQLDGFPSHVQTADEPCAEDAARSVRALANTLNARQSLYAQALASRGPDGLNAYLRALYVPALQANAKRMLGNRTLDEATLRFLAEFYFGGLLDYLCTQLNSRDGIPLASDDDPLATIVHTSLADAVDRYQRGKAL